MRCEYDGCTQTCRGVVSDADEYCNILRAYKKGVGDGRLMISDVQVEVSDRIEAEIRADERKTVLNEVIEKIKSGEHCSPSACKHYYDISDHFVDSDCTRECEDSIIEMIEQMKENMT